MTIGIMAAMHDEIAGLVQHVSEQGSSTVRRVGLRDFYVGQLQGQTCVIVLSGIGKVAAASTAVSLIHQFGVTEIVFSGLAGGLADHVQVGDVVIADRLIQHDMDARPLFPRYEIPLSGIAEFEVSSVLRTQLQQAARYFFEHELRECVLDATRAQFGLRAPHIHVGMIASGDQFIGAEHELQRLRKELPCALAVEMEGAAVAQICHEYAIPCSIIRTISDRADASAHVDFTRFLSEVASKYSSGIVRAYITARSRSDAGNSI